MLQRKTSREASRLRPASTVSEPPTHRELRLLPATCTAWIAAAAVTRLDPVAALVCAVLLAAAALCCALLCLCLAASRSRRILVACLAPLAVAALVCLPAAGAIAERNAGPVSTAIRGQADITALLTASSDARAISPDRFSGKERYSVEALLTQGTSHGQQFGANTPVLAIGDASWSGVEFGDRVNTAGRLIPTSPGDRAEALLIADTNPNISPAGGWMAYPTQLRNSFLRLTTDVTANDGLLAGMVIGDRSRLDESLEEAMLTTGLTHLTAVSGANCSYLLAFVFLAARAARLPRAAAVAAGIVALIGFVVLVRPEPSVLRAAVMGGIGVFAVLSGRGRLPLTLLFLTVVVLLTADPWLHGSYAFILSVTASSGLILFGPVLAARLGRWMPKTAAQLLAVPIAAQLFCTPVLVMLQPELPLYSVPANIAATPVVPFVTILGMTAVAGVMVFEPLAVPFIVAAGWGAGWVAAVAGFFSAAPGASLPWLGGLSGAILTGALSLAVILAVALAPRILRRVHRAQPGARGAARGRPRAAAWIAAGCALGLAVVVLWPIRAQDGVSWRVAACDVGQGDAFAIRTGSAEAILIDAGPEPDAIDNCLDQLSVETVQLLVLTHLHYDHYGGTEGVFRDRTVEQILYSSSEEELPAQVLAAAAEWDLVPGRLAAGMSGQHGPGGGEGSVSWTVLWPADGMGAASENDASGVLEVVIATPGARSVSVLFTGDIEEEAAAAMLRAHPALPARGVDILKVAHHGARNGGLELIRALRPRLAMISSGRDNDYGHPHPSITSDLSSEGVTVARTDQLGSFLVSIDGSALRVQRQRRGPLCGRHGRWQS